MNKFQIHFWTSIIIASAMALFSCTGMQIQRPDTTTTQPVNPSAKTSPIPEKLEPPRLIMGTGRINAGQLARFLETQNPQADTRFVRNLAACYVEEAAFEGINHDTAFAQMCLETGFLRYGGLVTPDMNNFCGLGSIGPGQNGERFHDPRTGVRAHIQHLKAYASTEPLKGTLVDPRYKWVRYGSAPDIAGLSGTWAADKSYGSKIAVILNRLYDFSFAKQNG